MSITKSAALVRHAEGKRPAVITKSMESSSVVMDSVNSETRVDVLTYQHWAQALGEVNAHITVGDEEIEAAKEAYQVVAEHLAQNLSWPLEAISILPQGSASTRTLIRSPNGTEKFDIDAVCQVDITRVQAAYPMGFFESVGQALSDLEAKPKRRCWYIPFPNRPFYLEFTPSVPLATIPEQTYSAMAPRYHAVRYKSTALAVVDTPTKGWKTSNPAGITQWVDDTAKRSLILAAAMESLASNRMLDSIARVPDHRVEITDTLRVAIRLFKRHRDMCVRRGTLDAGTKPISVIIVTLLTTCYEGLADLHRGFEHPVQVLDELAAYMPHLVLHLDGKYRVDNPTVEGENFAEKWNDDGGARYRSFTTWCGVLSADLKTILALTDPQAISKRVRDVFGVPAPSGAPSGLPVIGIAKPKATPATRGLA